MPFKTPEELKRFFPEKAKPSQIKWNHFFDALNQVQRKAEEAYLINGPIIWVADQAERLLIGPAVTLGRMVKQIDTGRTYVKQQAPGSSPLDWEDIGDTWIVIGDVDGLQDELDARILKDTSNDTTGILFGYNFSQSAPTGTISTQDLGASELVTIPFETAGSVMYAEVSKNFTIDATQLLSGLPWEGMPVTLLVKNLSVSSVEFNTPTNSAWKLWTLVNGASPVVVPSGWHLTLSVRPVRTVTGDPDYAGAGEYRYFVVYGLQAVAILP